jgi:hypothetical protein
MSLLDQDILNDIELARETINESDCSIVVVRYGKIISEKKGNGVKPILETVEELREEMQDSVVGDRILGKASSLILRYSNVKGVYSPQATKTAIALLIMGGIPCQVDELIPFIKNRYEDGMCPFEKILKDVDSPEKAYKILMEKVLNKK